MASASVFAATGGAVDSSLDSENANSGLILGCILGAIICPLVSYYMVTIVYRVIRYKIWAWWKIRRSRKIDRTASDIEKGEAPDGEESRRREMVDSRTMRSVDKREGSVPVEKEAMSEVSDGSMDRKEQKSKLRGWHAWKTWLWKDDGIEAEFYP